MLTTSDYNCVLWFFVSSGVMFWLCFLVFVGYTCTTYVVNQIINHIINRRMTLSFARDDRLHAMEAADPKEDNRS